MRNMKKVNSEKAGKVLSVLKIAGIIAMSLILLFIFLFALSPILLRLDFANKLFSEVLISLKSSDYKSTYVETLGALSGTFLGTFLAVLGAHYSQRIQDEKSKQKETIESATIVYNDFSFAISESKTNFVNAEKKQSATVSGIGISYDYYTRLQKSYNVRIDKEWIHTVAKLCHVMEDAEIKLIYSVYGNLESIIDSLNKQSDGARIHIVFSEFMEEFFEVDESKKELVVKDGDFVLKAKYSNLLKKLKELSNISDDVDKLLNE